MDTDSVIYTQKATEDVLPTGQFLGELTSELDEDDHIVEFVAGGPKQYAYKTLKGKQECKVRGFTLNYRNKKLLNFKAMKQLLLANQTGIVLTNDRKITRHKRKRKIYNRCEDKCYGIVYNKRARHEGSYSTLPYGF